MHADLAAAEQVRELRGGATSDSSEGEEDHSLDDDDDFDDEDMTEEEDFGEATFIDRFKQDWAKTPIITKTFFQVCYNRKAALALWAVLSKSPSVPRGTLFRGAGCPLGVYRCRVRVSVLTSLSYFRIFSFASHPFSALNVCPAHVCVHKIETSERSTPRQSSSVGRGR